MTERYLGTPAMPAAPDGSLTGHVPEHLPARLAVCVAAKRGIARTLGLLGVGAPERM